MSIKHAFQSAKPDGSDATKVQATAWNADHDLSGLVAADVTDFSEAAQDAVGGMLAGTATVNLTYTDATPELKADVITQMSITSDASGLKLSGDSASPGNTKLYGTDGAGVRGWYTQPTSGTPPSTKFVYLASTNFFGAYDIHGDTVVQQIELSGTPFDTIDAYLCTAMTQAIFNACTSCTAIDVHGNSSLISVNVDGASSLTSVTLGTLSVCQGINILNCGSLATIDISGCPIAEAVTLTGNALDQTSVDGVLADLDSGGLSNGTVDISGGTNSAPSAAGLTSKANLEGKGWTVTVNP